MNCFFISLDGKQADGPPPDVKWSPPPIGIDISNTRGLADALPSQRQS